MSEEREVERWSDFRWDQLEQLEKLLHECQNIDRGAPVISRLQGIIKSAEELDRFDHHRGRFSFMQFLKEQCRVGFDHGKRRKK